MLKKVLKLSVLIVGLVVLTSACTLPWKKSPTSVPVAVNQPTPVNEIASSTSVKATSTERMKKFENYNELNNFLAENERNNGLTMINYSDRLTTMSDQSFGSTITALPGLSNAVSATMKESSQASLGYSPTNNQVLGVEEADIVKTDGNYIYALIRNELKIIKASPAEEAAVVGVVKFKSAPQDIFINGTSLAVFGSDQEIYTNTAYKKFQRRNNYTFFKVYDLSNPAEPKLTRDLSLEGNYAEARLIGDYAYLFTNSNSNYFANESPAPRILEDGQVLPNVCEANIKCFTPDIYYFDIPYSSYNFTNITAINIKDENQAISGQSYLMNYNQTLYVSQNNVYLTYTKTLNQNDIESLVMRELIFPKLTADDQEKILKIEATENYILSVNEKKLKVEALLEKYINTLSEADRSVIELSFAADFKKKIADRSNDLEKTLIHKIAINGSRLEYKGSGEVKGQILNQFSLDENGDYLRVATTRNEIFSAFTDKPEESYSNVYILGNDLKVTGSLENLATNEKIYAARFMGDRVYLVTFRKTDPLYVISLSDPTKPVVLGAIKVPGFSTYLHPLDKNGNKLIGLGRDTEETTSGGVKIKGLKIALFDFTDLAKPKELDSYLIGEAGSDSIALQDHKALLYSEDKNLLAIPAVIRQNNIIHFNGSLIFNIVNNRFVLKGEINHSDFGDLYNVNIKRNLYIGNNLYSVSDNFLKINDLNDLKLIKGISFMDPETQAKQAQELREMYYNNYGYYPEAVPSSTLSDFLPSDLPIAN